MSAQLPAGAGVPVTLWYRRGDRGFEFNHLQNGHCETDRPAPKLPSQKGAWSSGAWVREHAWLDAGVPPVVLHDDQNVTARLLATAAGAPNAAAPGAH